MVRSRVALVTLVLLVSAAGQAFASDDPLFSKQWGVQKIGAEVAWTTGTGSGVIIAIVDTGVDLDHEDLGTKLVEGYDFVEKDPSPADEDGHGTHVAGIAAAITGNGRGVAGTAPEAKIMPVRVLDEDGSGSSDDVVSGIRWAVDHGATVVNLSLGELTPIRIVLGSSMEDGIDYAWSHGAVPVVAAGNDILFPSGYANVNALAVAATNQNDGKPLYSNGTGDAKWGMAAPGDAILSTLPGHRYGSLSGTSMATPHVSGAAAVLLSLGLTPKQVVDKLLETAKDIGAPGKDGDFGSGRLDLANAVSGLSKVGGGSTPAPGGSGTGASSGGTKARPRSPTGAPPGSEPPPVGAASPGSSPESLAEQQASDESGPNGSLILNLVLGAVLVLGIGGLALWSRLKGRGVPG